MRYFDKERKPISFEKWVTLFEQSAYKRVAFNRLWWGGTVSTVWLGLDHQLDRLDEQPLIFETMVFDKSLNVVRGVGEIFTEKGPHVLYCERYPKLSDARFGHWYTYLKASLLII